MKRKLFTLVFIASTLSFASLAGCNNSVQEVNEVQFVGQPEFAFLGVEYDFEPYFEKVSGYEYSMTAYYDFYGEDISIKQTDDFKFVQYVYSDVYVDITGVKGDKTIKGTAIVPVVAKPDIIDQWMYNIYPMEEKYIEKEINYDRTYITGDDSTSSLKFSFSGNNEKFSNTSPCSFLTMVDFPNNNRFSILDELDVVEAWENAVFSMDIYNPNANSITIVPNINYKKANHSYLSSDIKFTFWNALDDFRITVPSESWVHYDLSFKSINIRESITFVSRGDTWNNSDNFFLQVVNDGVNKAESGHGENYSFSFYVDNIDINAYSKEKFPDLDTDVKLEYLDLFTNDENLVAYASAHEGKYVKNELLTTDKLAENTSKYSVKLPLQHVDSGNAGNLHSFISGSVVGWKILDISNAIINFKVYFDNADRHLMLTFDSDFNVFTNYYNMYIEEAGTQAIGWNAIKMDNGWYDVTINCAEIEGLFTYLVPATYIRAMRIFVFTNNSDSSRPSNVYFDSLTMSGYETSPYHDGQSSTWGSTTSPFALYERPCEDYKNHPDDFSLGLSDWTNVSNFEKHSHTSATHSSEVTSENSILSLHLTNNSNGWQFSFILIAEWNHWNDIDLTGKDVIFDIKAENYIASNNVGFYIYSTTSNPGDEHVDSETASVYFQPVGGLKNSQYETTDLDNGWVRIKLLSSIWGTSKANRVFKIGFGTCSKDSPDLNNCGVYIDNLHFLPSEDPYVQYEAEDLINVSLEKGIHSVCEITNSTVSENSSKALHLSNNSGGWQYSFILVAESNDWNPIDLTSSDVVFDVKVENYKVSNNIGFEIYNTTSPEGEAHTDSKSAEIYFEPRGGITNSNVVTTDLDNGWVRVKLSATIWSGNKGDRVFKIAISTTSKDSTDVANCNIYIDNLHFEEHS